MGTIVCRRRKDGSLGYTARYVSSRACRLRGLQDLRFHDLRHEATSRLFERGYDIPEVARFTLHESWTTLKRYTHLRPEQVPEKAAPSSFKPQEVRH